MEDITVCVTGGSGFVGAHLCQLLVENKHLGKKKVRELRVLDLVKPQEKLFELAESGGIALKFIQGSICNKVICSAAFDKVDIVVHSASLVDFGNKPHDLLIEVNVEGTRVVIESSKAANVRALIYTSSLDVLTTWGDNVQYKSDRPYPPTMEENSSGMYGFSKSLAERLVLEANGAVTQDGSTKLSTCALRPRGVYGENDPFYFTSLLQASHKFGRMLSKIGHEDAIGDHAYVGNVAFAHICAMNRIFEAHEEGVQPKIGGKGLNLSHEPPCSIYEKTGPILDAFKVPQPNRSVNAEFMFHLAHVLEVLIKFVPRFIRPQLLLTRESVEAICRERTFHDPKALEELGFSPLYTVEEAMCRTIKWLREEWKDRPNQQETQSGDQSTYHYLKYFIITVASAFAMRLAVFRMLGF